MNANDLLYDIMLYQAIENLFFLVTSYILLFDYFLIKYIMKKYNR